jgi:hypothetical protein
VTAHNGRGQGDDLAYEGVVLPANGEPWTPDQQREAERAAQQPQPAEGRQWDSSWGPDTPSPPVSPPSEMPPSEMPPSADRAALPYGSAPPAPLPPGDLPAAPPQPPQPPPSYGHADADATQMLPPQQPPPAPAHGPGPASAGQIGEPWPPPQQPYGDADATQMLPPQQYGQQYGRQEPQPYGAGDADATQMLPRQQPYGEAEATQMLPPQSASGALPPEAGYGGQYTSPADAGTPPAAAPYGHRPGMPGERQPPSEFDNLFRTDAPAGPTGTAGPPTAPAPQAGGRAARRDAGREQGPRGRRNLSPAMLAGIGLVAVVAVGLGVGALTSGGGEDPKAAPGESTAPAGGASAAPADSAEEQAEALNKLLEQSNNSRTSVIRAVQNIKACKQLDQAATDLRAAADQRNGLVSRLSEMETGALPKSSALNSALAEAWKASAKADDAYAAWADQVAGKKGCHKGKARTTHKTAVGNRASGEATAAKKEAAGLWNPTAREYGLPERQYTQL